MKMNVLITLVIALVFNVKSIQAAQNDKPSLNSTTTTELLVFKTPTCGCCKKWIVHLTAQEVLTQSRDLQDLSFIKHKFGIAANYRSCHTAISRDGYAFEGHVPAKYIKQFLAQPQQNAIGLSVPAMPVGSPGMEVGDKFMPYQVLILFNDGSSKVYAQVNSYEEQF